MKHDELAKQILKRLDAMKSKRHNWENNWQRVADFCLPDLANITRVRVEGDTNRTDRYTDIGIVDNRTMANGMFSYLVQGDWLDFEPEDSAKMDIQSVATWYDEVSRRTLSQLRQTNFFQTYHSYWLGKGCFGTYALAFKETNKADIISFSAPHIMDIYIDENSSGIVDTVYRVFEWNARQLMQEFPDKELPKTVMDAQKNNLDTLFRVVHAVYPNEQHEIGKLNKEAKEYKSIYVLDVEDTLLSSSGFDYMPIKVSRFYKVDKNSPYGRSPAWEVLPTLNLLNKIEYDRIYFADKKANPPYVIPSQVGIEQFDNSPGGLIIAMHMDADHIPRPLQDTGDFSIRDGDGTFPSDR